METLEELKQQKQNVHGILDHLEIQRHEINDTIGMYDRMMERIEQKIEDYENYAKQEKEREANEVILKWLSGQTKTQYNIGNYKGLIVPEFDVYRFSCQPPERSKEDILAIMEHYGCKAILIETSVKDCLGYETYTAIKLYF